jgi:hypothetical protein
VNRSIWLPLVNGRIEPVSSVIAEKQMTGVLKVASLAATVFSRTDAGLLRLPQADDLLLLVAESRTDQATSMHYRTVWLRWAYERP